jgi:DNA-binding transcriptional ArsR family regulator
LLQQVQKTFYKGIFYWVYTLPAPKDARTVLEVLEEIPPAGRLNTALFHPGLPPEAKEVFERVTTRQRWSEEDQKIIHSVLGDDWPSRKDIADFLEVITHFKDMGELYLSALRTYHEVFFAEEESRIRPALEAAVSRTQALARQLDLPDLLAEITEGFHFAEGLKVSELVLVPSFWITPLVAYTKISPEKMLFLFGARPPDASLVPGEVVPDALFLALKALADPTRLRILRYLTAEPLTPVQLSRRLRLRAPTVVHHLRALRLAGLVHITLESGKKIHYTARQEAVTTMVTALQNFLKAENDHQP